MKPPPQFELSAPVGGQVQFWSDLQQTMLSVQLVNDWHKQQKQSYIMRATSQAFWLLLCTEV